jgi:hypothetical protein
MEGHAGSLATGAGTSTALALTGFNTIAYIVAGLTLLFAGLALLKLLPHIGRPHPSAAFSGKLHRFDDATESLKQGEVDESPSANSLRRA